jgi:hypothetical protein
MCCIAEREEMAKIKQIALKSTSTKSEVAYKHVYQFMMAVTYPDKKVKFSKNPSRRHPHAVMRSKIVTIQNTAGSAGYTFDNRDVEASKQMLLSFSTNLVVRTGMSCSPLSDVK